MTDQDTVLTRMLRAVRTRARWRYAAGSFAFGVLYASLALVLGVEIRWGSHDLTILGGFLIELSFAGFGFLWGLAVEARHAEAQASAQIRTQLDEIDGLRVRLAHEEKLASLGLLAGAMAHEVRNPLAVIRSMVQNLAEDADTEARECHDEILDEVDRLTAVTARLTHFAGPVSLARAHVTPTEIVRRTGLLATRMLEARGIVLAIEEPPTEAAPILADADLLCQVLLGLVDNAGHATPTGGTVTLHCTRTSEATIFSVRDQGDGVPVAMREQIFEPFVTTRADGSGLGLAVAREIISAHGGTIDVHDVTPRGAELRVTIPRVV